jgi:hypothetical protein
MAAQSEFCSVCGGGKPCRCGACEFNTGPESFGGPGRCAGPDTPKKGTGIPKKLVNREEVCNFLKTSLQEIRGAALTDSTLFIPSRHHVSHSKKMNMKGHYKSWFIIKTVH